MKPLSIDEIRQIQGGLHIHIGAFIAAIVIGAVTGGPVGVGYVLTTTVMAKGIDNLADMAHDEWGNPR